MSHYVCNTRMFGDRQVINKIGICFIHRESLSCFSQGHRGQSDFVLCKIESGFLLSELSGGQLTSLNQDKGESTALSINNRYGTGDTS